MIFENLKLHSIDFSLYSIDQYGKIQYFKINSVTCINPGHVSYFYTCEILMSGNDNLLSLGCHLYHIEITDPHVPRPNKTFHF